MNYCNVTRTLNSSSEFGLHYEKDATDTVWVLSGVLMPKAEEINTWCIVLSADSLASTFLPRVAYRVDQNIIPPENMQYVCNQWSNF